MAMKKNMFISSILLSIEVLLSSSMLQAQDVKYTDARDLTLVGKAVATPEFYHRLDTVKYTDLPPKIKYLATKSTGLAIGFKTNSKSISAKWAIKPDKVSANLTAIAQKGLDLYIKRNGVWEFAAIGKPALDSDSSKCNLISDMDGTEKECLLYLPIFSETKQLEIGTDSLSDIEALPYPFDKKILIYGSSIVHGAEASRAGTTYVSKLSRRTGLNFINLGFSGNARMENALADYLADTDADAYILDCVPNATVAEITGRTVYMIKTIRNKHPEAPIIVMQSIIMDIGNFSLKEKENIRIKNETMRTEVENLKKAGVEKLYFIEGTDLIGSDHEGTGDGIHPNDLGFERMAGYLQPILEDVLKKNNILNIK